MAYVIKHLNQNLIFHISEQTSSRNVDIRPGKKELHCDCLLCTYERMELVRVLERLKHAENKIPYDAAFVAALLECNEIASSITIGLVESALREKKMLEKYSIIKNGEDLTIRFKEYDWTLFLNNYRHEN